MKRSADARPGRASAIGREDALRVFEGSPFVGWWGFELEELARGTATVRLPFRAEFIRPGGTLQGACSMALADVAFWLALMTLTGPEPLALTIEMKTNFLRPARGDLRSVARVLKAGRRIVYGDSSTTDASGDLVAHHTLTYIRAAGAAPSD